MANILAALLAALQLLVPICSPGALTQRLRSGEWLRFHVVAQDDTQEMQRVKICVRDAVQDCFRENRPADAVSMQAAAEELLPLLTQAAEAAARREGFTAPVAVTLGMFPFNDRELCGIPVPAGDYPALVVRLGDARGRNWWGLLDPELSFRLAQARTEESAAEPVWDWSLRALLSALLGIPMAEEGV